MKKYLSILLILGTFLSGCSKEATCVGIIGGADGPTAIYVTSNINLKAVAVIVAVITVLVITYLRKRK